jgi:putative aldouronate transport system permease protein
MSETAIDELLEKWDEEHVLTKEEALAVLNLPDDKLDKLIETAYALRLKYKGKKVSIQLLTNVRSGNCSQNCAYCAQSCESHAAIEKYKRVSDEKLYGDNDLVDEKHLARHCIGLSGIRFTDAEIEDLADRIRKMKKKKAEEPMRTMTKERKKEGPRLGHKGRADAKASRQLLLLCIPAIIGYILFNYIPMGAAVIIPFKNYKFSKGILGSDWCGLANFKWIIQSVALDRALRNTVLYGLLFMVLSPVTNVIIALLLFEITSRRRLKTYQTIITFPNFMSMVIVGYIVYAILSPRTGLMNQIIQFFGGDPVDVYMNSKYWPFILTVVNIWKGIGMGSMMYFAALMGIDTSLYEAAEIDGAGRFQKMLHISLPHLVPLICIFTIMNAGTLISGNFDLFYVIPRNTSTLYATTDILNTYVYRSLQESSYAIGATTGLIQSVVGMFLVLLSNWIVKKISPDNSMF